MVKSRANSHLLNVTDPLEQIEKVGTFAFELSVVVDELEKMMREENLSRSMTSSTAAAAKSQADTATPQGKTVHRGNNSTRSLVSTSNALSDGIRSTASSVKSSRQSLPLGSKAMINGQQSRSVNASRAMLLSRTEL